MRYRISSTLFAVAIASTLTVVACDDDPTGSVPKNGLQYGAAVQVGNGTGRTYIKYVNSQPVEAGVSLSETALNGLPNDPMGHMHPFVLTFPSNNPTAYNHVAMHWNYMGHEPPGIYDIPHFDFHFYTTPQAARLAITDDATKAANFPPANQIPAGYIAPAAVSLPQMGVHWLDPQSPELSGTRFTKTFIYGTWDGQLIFAEPMITREFLLTKPNVTLPIPVAEKVATPGRYASAYAIRWDESTKSYQVAMANLVEKN